VFGTGEQSRCFGHVDDVVEGILACIASPGTVGEIFNLGSTEQITITALAEKIIAATGSKSPIRYIPYSQAYGEGFEDMEHRIPDLRKAHLCFGYKPKRCLDEIISAVIQHTQQQKAHKGTSLSHVA